MTYRFNEERQVQHQERLSSRQVSFWYLAPRLGETFLGHARSRAYLEYQTGGLWRGTVWGHPVWLVAYQDVPVEEDTIPLHLLDREPAAPRALGELVLRQEALLHRFAKWLFALQPGLWEEIRHMASKSTSASIIDWEAVGKIADLDEVVRVLPPDRVIQILGVERAIEVIGVERVLKAVGLEQVLKAVGLERVVETSGAEKVLDVLLKQLKPEQLQEMLRRRQQNGEEKP